MRAASQNLVAKRKFMTNQKDQDSSFLKSESLNDLDADCEETQASDNNVTQNTSLNSPQVKYKTPSKFRPPLNPILCSDKQTNQNIALIFDRDRQRQLTEPMKNFNYLDQYLLRLSTGNDIIAALKNNYKPRKPQFRIKDSGSYNPNENSSRKKLISQQLPFVFQERKRVSKSIKTENSQITSKLLSSKECESLTDNDASRLPDLNKKNSSDAFNITFQNPFFAGKEQQISNRPIRYKSEYKSEENGYSSMKIPNMTRGSKRLQSVDKINAISERPIEFQGLVYRKKPKKFTQIY